MIWLGKTSTCTLGTLAGCSAGCSRAVCYAAAMTRLALDLGGGSCFPGGNSKGLIFSRSLLGEGEFDEVDSEFTCVYWWIWEDIVLFFRRRVSFIFRNMSFSLLSVKKKSVFFGTKFRNFYQFWWLLDLLAPLSYIDHYVGWWIFLMSCSASSYENVA